MSFDRTGFLITAANTLDRYRKLYEGLLEFSGLGGMGLQAFCDMYTLADNFNTHFAYENPEPVNDRPKVEIADEYVPFDHLDVGDFFVYDNSQGRPGIAYGYPRLAFKSGASSMVWVKRSKDEITTINKTGTKVRKVTIYGGPAW